MKKALYGLLACLCLGAGDPELYINHPPPAEVARVRQLVRNSPRNQVLLEKLAVMLLVTGQDADAERLFRRSYELKPNARNCYHLGVFQDKRRSGSGQALLRQAHRFAPRGEHIAQALGLPSSADAISRGYDAVRTQPNSQLESEEWTGTLDLPEKTLKVRAAGPRLVAVSPTKTYVLDRVSKKLLSTLPSKLKVPGGTLGDRQYDPRTIDLWETPEYLRAADEHHLLLTGVYVVNQRTGKATAWFSGGERWPEDVTFLVPGGRYLIHEGVLIVTMCDAATGKVIWSCEPPRGQSQMDLVKMTDEEVWVYASYTGRVYAYGLPQGRLIWECWHWQVPPP